VKILIEIGVKEMISASTMKELTSKHQKLTGEWKKKDYKGCKVTLDDMKLLMIKMQYLPTEVNINEHKQVKMKSNH
jgi:membrane protein insertase Oxa1/YidC/SpoIIIJ